jgi:phosphate transport system substrate-binding protein
MEQGVFRMHRLAIVALALALIAQPALAQTAAVRVQGTTNLAPMLAQAATAYDAGGADGHIVVHGTSSGAGIAALRSGSIDVAASDIADSDPAFVDTTIGAIGFAFVANHDAGIKNLTRAQLQGIFSGTITNWKQVGGDDRAIVIIGREIGTGTRLVLEEKVAKTLIPTRLVTKASAMLKAVEETPGALGYTASYFVENHGDLVVTYEGVAPTAENVKAHTYAFETDEHLLVRKDATARARAFVDRVAHDRTLLQSFGIY